MKFHVIYSILFRSYELDIHFDHYTKWILVNEGIISKLKKRELSFLTVTHCLDKIRPSVKFHEYIPYGLGVTNGTQFLDRTHRQG